MKKLLLFAALLCSIQFAFAAFPSSADNAKAKPATSLNSMSHQQQHELMKQFATMSVKDYETMTGKKLNFFEKMSFKLTQERMRHQLKRDDEGGGLFTDFNIGGFLLGFLLGLIGVLLAYIFSSDSNFHKWTWIGLAFWVVIVLLIII